MVDIMPALQVFFIDSTSSEENHKSVSDNNSQWAHHKYYIEEDTLSSLV